jgi:Terminase large subunit, T4likevirus-type, N-terminal
VTWRAKITVTRLPLQQGQPSAVGEVCPNAGQSVSDWTKANLSFVPDDLQTQILDSAAPRLILCCTRQWGKSTVAAAKALHFAWHNPGTLTLFASASQNQSAELLAKLRGFAAGLTQKPNKRDSANEVILPNGSRILALPQSPSTVRGYTAHLVVIDEAAFVDDTILAAAVTPTLARTNGALWLLSSAGRQSGFFYKLWTRENMWTKFKATAAECPRISAEFLDREKVIQDAASFQREYFCEFRAGARQQFDRTLIESSIDPSFSERKVNYT